MSNKELYIEYILKYKEKSKPYSLWLKKRTKILYYQQFIRPKIKWWYELRLWEEKNKNHTIKI